MLAVTAVAYALIGGILFVREFRPSGNLFGIPTASRPKPIAASAWRDFAPPNGHFRVSLPGTPSAQPVPAGLQAKMEMYTLDLPGADRAFAVGYAEVPADDWKRLPLADRFTGARDGMFANTPGSTVRDEKRIMLHCCPGREFHLDVEGKGRIIARCYAVNRRLITLLIAGSGIDSESPDVKRFFESFRVDPPDPNEVPRPGDYPPDWEDEDTVPNRLVLDFLNRENGDRDTSSTTCCSRPTAAG